MNTLWEAYVASLLRRQAPATLDVRTQVRSGFWTAPGRRRALRPDIALHCRESQRAIAVIDTKWKRPSGGTPSDPDLKQMFAYNEALGTSRAFLAYPAEREPRAATRGAFLGGRHEASTVYLGVDGGGEEWAYLWASATSSFDGVR